MATSGLFEPLTGSAVPPFFGNGQLLCTVVPPQPEVEFHNAVQGRATTFKSSGQTVSYGAVAFQRLSPGDFDGHGPVRLNGSTYARCPDKLHFDVLADRPGASSEMVLVPCNQDFSFGDPDDISVHFTIINEFEQAFSATTQFACFHRATLGAITHSLDRSTLGTDTAHVIVRGTSSPVSVSYTHLTLPTNGCV